jgi:hypothetical protein
MGLGSYLGKSLVVMELQICRKFLKTVKCCSKWKRLYRVNLDHNVDCCSVKNSKEDALISAKILLQYSLGVQETAAILPVTELTI